MGSITNVPARMSGGEESSTLPRLSPGLQGLSSSSGGSKVRERQTEDRAARGGVKRRGKLRRRQLGERTGVPTRAQYHKSPANKRKKQKKQRRPRKNKVRSPTDAHSHKERETRDGDAKHRRVSSFCVCSANRRSPCGAERSSPEQPRWEELHVCESTCRKTNGKSQHFFESCHNVTLPVHVYLYRHRFPAPALLFPEPLALPLAHGR